MQAILKPLRLRSILRRPLPIRRNPLQQLAPLSVALLQLLLRLLVPPAQPLPFRAQRLEPGLGLPLRLGNPLHQRPLVFPPRLQHPAALPNLLQPRLQRPQVPFHGRQVHPEFRSRRPQILPRLPPLLQRLLRLRHRAFHRLLSPLQLAHSRRRRRLLLRDLRHLFFQFPLLAAQRLLPLRRQPRVLRQHLGPALRLRQLLGHLLQPGLPLAHRGPRGLRARLHLRQLRRRPLRPRLQLPAFLLQVLDLPRAPNQTRTRGPAAPRNRPPRPHQIALAGDYCSPPLRASRHLQRRRQRLHHHHSTQQVLHYRLRLGLA